MHRIGIGINHSTFLGFSVKITASKESSEANFMKSSSERGVWSRASGWLGDFWEPEEADRAGGGVPFLAVAAVVMGVLVLRRPDALFYPQFWAEDGSVFFKEQMESGFLVAVGIHYAGYLHLVPRVIAGLASVFPLRFAPLCYNFVALCLAAVVCAWFSRGEFRRIVRSDGLRALACVGFACAPTGWEIVGTVTNLQWYLLWWGYLLWMSPLPAGRKGRVAFVGAWAAIGLSAPGAIALMPFWMVRLVVRRDRGERVACLACLVPPLLLVSMVDPSEVGAITEPFAAAELIFRGVRKLFAWRVVVEALVGETDPVHLADRMGDSLAYLGFLTVVVGCALLAVYGSVRVRTWLVLSAVFVVLYLAVAVVGRPDHVLKVSLYKMNWGGGRYFFVPLCVVLMGFFAALSVAPRWRKLLVVPILMVLVFSIVGQFRTPPFEDLRWAEHAALLERAMNEKRTGWIEVPVNPSHWRDRVLRIHFIEGRAVPEGSAPEPLER
jgi:hypothetical protein